MSGSINRDEHKRSVARGFSVKAANAFSNGVAEQISTTYGKFDKDTNQGQMSTWIVATANIYIHETHPATTSGFLLLANTYFEIPVAEMESFSIMPAGDGILYMMEFYT
jgi:hypothetical protein